ncbi:hypothetical protein BC940DRAFT_265929, partial [Gongronella butleri]
MIIALTYDIMHGAWLGVARFFIEELMERNVLTAAVRKEFAEKARSIKMSPGMTACPDKLKTMSNFTADQLVSWTFVYRVVLLPPLLKDKGLDFELDMWMKFVARMRILMNPMIDVEELTKARRHLRAFCLDFDKYAEEHDLAVQINVHNLWHYIDDVIRFGPPNGTRTFAFESEFGEPAAIDEEL